MQVLFYICAALSVLAAFLAITRKNPVLSAVWLAVTMFALAVIYVLLQAYFLAAVQIVVYAGAVLMLFVFVIMMLNLRAGMAGQLRNMGAKLLGLLAAGLVLSQLLAAARGAREPAAAEGQVRLPDDFGGAAALGQLLFTRYVYPLEVLAILLLVAIVGALVLAGKEAE